MEGGTRVSNGCSPMGGVTRHHQAEDVILGPRHTSRRGAGQSAVDPRISGWERPISTLEQHVDPTLSAAGSPTATLFRLPFEERWRAVCTMIPGGRASRRPWCAGSPLLMLHQVDEASMPCVSRVSRVDDQIACHVLRRLYRSRRQPRSEDKRSPGLVQPCSDDKRR